MTRSWLAMLVPLYRAAVSAKNAAYARELFKTRRLNSPVISIGNLSVGGAGKTPLTIRLAQLLSSAGCSVDVLSRGYGRTSRGTQTVDANGSPAQFGDEPLLIARRAGIPVFVGASRWQAGRLAEAAASKRRVHLLDDGFQHRQLARDVDIVVLHRTDLSEKLLPAGRLREPLSALARADFLALRREDTDLEPAIRALGVTAPVWIMDRSLGIPTDLTATTERAVAFCGIARPDEFFSSLIAREINVELSVAFADHHRYTRGDIDRLAALATRVQAGAFVITEKDAVKLDPTLTSLLEAVAPVRVVRLDLTLQDETTVLSSLLARLPTL